MKVLHISSRSDIGGGPEHVFQLGKQLNAFGDIIQFAAIPKQKPYFKRFQDIFERRVFIIPVRSFSVSKLVSLHLYVRQFNIDVIHSHGKGAGLYSRLLKLLNYKIKVVHTFHGWHVGGYNQLLKHLYTFYEFALAGLTNNFICVSYSERKIIPKAIESTYRSKFVVIPNGVEVVEGSRGYDDRKIDILIVTRFDFQKNFEFAIQVAQRLRGFNFTVLGEINEDGRKLREYCSSVGLNNITFVGGTNRVRSYMSNAKVILSTSRWEGLSLGLLEGMSEGCVPVLSDVTGNNELKLPRQLFYQADDLQGATLSIKQVLGDHSVWGLLSQKVKSIVVDEYSVLTMASAVQTLYCKVVCTK